METKENKNIYIKNNTEIDICDICGGTGASIGGGMMIHSMQKTKEGKGIRYKTTYYGDQNTPCKPCRKYIEHPLEDGAIECDFNLNPIK